MRKPHVLWALVPVVAFLSTPFLPFVNGPHLWLGIPSVLAWCLFWTAGTTASLAVVEHFARHPDEDEDTDPADANDRAAHDSCQEAVA